jgi:hypothetical protein
MPSVRAFLDPGGRMLARRLDELCSTLEGLAARLHGTIANAIGETIGGIVRDTALRVLSEVTRYLPNPASDPHPLTGDERAPLSPPEYAPDERGYWDDEAEFEPHVENRSAPPKSARLPTALSAGLQAASWWLQRCRCQCRIMTTFAIGLAAAGVAYIGGPLAVVVLGLAGTATQFTTLSEAIDAGASVFGLFDHR